jgi:hypothetical protein
VTPIHWEGMDDLLKPIDITDALRWLQGYIGKRVTIEFNDYGDFFGGGFDGYLLKVQPLPPDDHSLRVVLAGGSGFFFDPAVVRLYLACDSGPPQLEIRRKAGPAITVGPALSPAPT